MCFLCVSQLVMASTCVSVAGASSPCALATSSTAAVS